MKKILILLSAALLSCSREKHKESFETCVVKGIETHYQYHGITNERNYTLTTDCGYVINTVRHVQVGDTITVRVIDMRKTQ